MKIKITKETKEIDGQVIDKSVTFFGTSAHIPFSKSHLGKIVSVVVPSEPKYIWLFNSEKLKEVVKECKKIIASEPESRFTTLKEEFVFNIQQKTFSLDDIIKVVEILNKDKKNKSLVESLRQAYNI